MLCVEIWKRADLVSASSVRVGHLAHEARAVLVREEGVIVFRVCLRVGLEGPDSGHPTIFEMLRRHEEVMERGPS